MNVTDLLSEYRVEFKRHGEHHHVSRGWVGIDCPHCSPGSDRFRLGIHLSRLFASCWSCGWKRLADVLADLGVPRDRLESLSGTRDKFTRREEQPVGRLVIPRGVGPLQEPHRKYLRGRGFDPQELEEVWGVRGIGIDPRLSWRVWIPVTMDGKVVSWTTRTTSDAPGVIRYLTARPTEEVVSAKKVLFGEDYCSHAVVVCEGPFDAMAIGPGAVATMGLSVTESQMTRISKYPVRVLCFDSDRQAQRRAASLCDALTTFPGETYQVELSGKDAASSPREEIMELRKRFLS